MDNQTKDAYSAGYRFHSEGPVRSKEYVEQQCKLLARQLWYIGQMVAQTALPAGKEIESSQDRFNFEYKIDKSFEEN